jgi:hypothetical protein
MKTWPGRLVTAGLIAMLVGAIDPMEGSLLILPGSGLVALGTFLGGGERRIRIYRLAVFLLITFGVAALIGLTMAGGVGGSSGLSMWWGVLVVPYLIGWSMGIWGPDSPRWALWLGLGVSVWYLAMPILVMTRQASPHVGDPVSIVITVIAAIGILTVGGCIYRLRKTNGV